MTGRPAAALLICLLVAACQSGGLGASGPKGNAPYGVDPGEKGVDGLLVGHRLMEAGEYELALKAYYRAAAEDGMNVDVLSAIGSADLALGALGRPRMCCAVRSRPIRASCRR